MSKGVKRGTKWKRKATEKEGKGGYSREESGYLRGVIKSNEFKF